MVHSAVVLVNCYITGISLVNIAVIATLFHVIRESCTVCEIQLLIFMKDFFPVPCVCSNVFLNTMICCSHDKLATKRGLKLLV